MLSIVTPTLNNIDGLKKTFDSIKKIGNQVIKEWIIVDSFSEDQTYQFVENITVFASGKDGIFNAGTPIGKTTKDGEVKLFVDPNQLSFVTVNLIKPSKEIF